MNTSSATASRSSRPGDAPASTAAHAQREREQGRLRDCALTLIIQSAPGGESLEVAHGPVRLDAPQNALNGPHWSRSRPEPPVEELHSVVYWADMSVAMPGVPSGLPFILLPKKDEVRRAKSYRLDGAHGLPAPKRWPASSAATEDAADQAPPADPTPLATPVANSPAVAATATTIAVTAAALPDSRRISSAPAAPIKGSARRLRETLLERLGAGPWSAAFLAASPSPEGVAELVELGWALSEVAEKEVLLVDADFGGAGLSRTFGLDSAVGLSDLLLAEQELDDCLYGAANRGLTIIPAGTQVGPRLAQSGDDRWRPLWQSLRERFSWILVHASAQSPAVGVLARSLDATFLAISLDDTPRETVMHAAEHLRQQDISLLGCIVYNAPPCYR